MQLKTNNSINTNCITSGSLDSFTQGLPLLSIARNLFAELNASSRRPGCARDQIRLAHGGRESSLVLFCFCVCLVVDYLFLFLRCWMTSTYPFAFLYAGGDVMTSWLHIFGI